MAFFLYPHSRTATQTTQTVQSLDMGAQGNGGQPAAPQRVQPTSFGGWVAHMWRWFWDMEEPSPKPASFGEIRQIRTAFHASLSDMQTARAYRVRYQIEASRSLRELWHLRADIFEIVAENAGEAEAKKRTQELNHFFPDGPARHPREGLKAGKVTTW